jgi:hypothetical protein
MAITRYLMCQLGCAVLLAATAAAAHHGPKE